MNEEINKFLTRKFNRYSLIYYANGKERKSSDCIAKINCYIEGQKVVKFAGIVESPVFTINSLRMTQRFLQMRLNGMGRMKSW